MSTAPVEVGVLFPIGGPEIPRLLERVERRMHELAADGGALAPAAVGTLEAGGKRLRPLLVFLASGVPAPETEELVSAALAVELVHSATLVHDDILDRSALRRGRPTVVALNGRLTATATGDYLFARAFGELARTGSPQAVRTLSRAASELAEGELMQRADAWRSEVTIERYLERCRLKTAVLFRAACELGAAAGGLAVASLGAFGERIGLAFQLLDDVLDVTGPPERTGKPRGADLLDGTLTLPMILARAADPELARLDIRSITGSVAAAAVAERITAMGALEQVRKRALSILDDARASLAGLSEAQRAALELVAAGIVDRYA